jgi:rhodanese-related sulfurtransferase
MRLLDSLKKTFARPEGPIPAAPASAVSNTPKPEPEEIRVPEVTATELMAELRGREAPLVLDCRENHERRQGYIPGSVHIVMREIPYHLDEIDRSANIVVACAHGNRSYSVAGYLIENGFRARSLRGGTVGWQTQGGAIARL